MASQLWFVTEVWDTGAWDNKGVFSTEAAARAALATQARNRYLTGKLKLSTVVDGQVLYLPI